MPCTKEEVLKRRVICAKWNRDKFGSHEHDTHVQKFGAAKHFVPKNVEGKPTPLVYQNTQSEYVGNLDKVKLLQMRVNKYDILEPLIIPTLLDKAATNVSARWGVEDTKMPLFKHWLKISLRQACLYQKDAHIYADDNEDLVTATGSSSC